MEKVKFEELSLSTEMQRAITEIGYEEASPIQAEAIPALLAGRDVIGQAQTGTGKTAAFSIPAIEGVDTNSRHTPTGSHSRFFTASSTRFGRCVCGSSSTHWVSTSQGSTLSVARSMRTKRWDWAPRTALITPSLGNAILVGFAATSLTPYILAQL